MRVPFYVRGPGIPAGGNAKGMVSLMDVGATILELSGAVSPGERTTDGKSIVPLLKASGPAPPGWRENGILIEHLGENNQWMGICGWVFNATNCPSPRDAPYLIDGPQNTWAQWRVVNETHDFSYTEFRSKLDAPKPSATNWTELYNTGSDPWQGENLAKGVVQGGYSEQLWAIANCAVDTCP